VGSGLASPISARQLATPRGKTLQFSRETPAPPAGKIPPGVSIKLASTASPSLEQQMTVQSLVEADRREAAAGAGVPPITYGFPAFRARSSRVQSDGRKRRSCGPVCS